MKNIKKIAAWGGVVVILFLSVALMLPASPSFALTTLTLSPNGQGFYTTWINGESEIDETGGVHCSVPDSIRTATTSARESVVIDLSSIPNNATIQSVDVTVYDRGDSAAGGTYQTFARLNGADTDSGTNLAASNSGNSDVCSSGKTQSINVVDVVKSATTTLEVGVLKTSSNSAAVRVGAIQAVVTYAPLTHTITTSASAGGTITPAGPITVNDGASTTLVIAPTTGYIVDDVSVDSASQGRINSYKFSNVIANHSISATFQDGWSAPSASSDGDNDVTGDANVFTSNDSYAVFDDQNDEADFLNFNLGIPSGSVIEGIQVALEGNRPDPRTVNVLLSWNGGSSWTTGSGTGVKNAGSFTASDATFILGGTSDTWGRSWSASEMTNANFRLRVDAVTSGPGDRLNLDQIQVKVTYSAGPGTLKVVKNLINDDGGNAATTSFSFIVDDGSPVFFDEDGEVDVPVSAGLHTVTEVDTEGYTESYECSDISVASGGTATCTITNNDEPGHLVIAKNALGGDDTFDFKVTGGDLNLSPRIETSSSTGSTDPIEIKANTDYTIDEPSVPEGWDFTGVSCEYDGDSVGAEGPAPTSHVVSVAPGETVTCTYTNTKRASFSLTKYTEPEDLYFGFELNGGPGGQGNIPATSSPIGNGDSWTLSGLLPGTYTLAELDESLPEGWTGLQWAACNGNGSNDPAGSVAQGEGGLEITLNPGENMSCQVNNTQDAVVSGQKFEDTDGTGSGNTGNGLSGWQIDFESQGESTTTQSVVTDEGGSFAIRLQPGTYKVCETQQEGWYQSYPTEGTTNAVSCGEGAMGYWLSVGAASSTNGIDFGNYRTGSIAGFKWHDEDADGVPDETELGLGDWTIQLYRGESLVDEKTTDAEGAYQFTGVHPGDYTLREVLQPGWAQTFPAGAGSLAVTTVSNGNVTGKNFGNVEDATISGMKWNDLNADGFAGEEEPGLANWTIYVDSNDNSVKDTDEPSAVTDEEGKYTISGLLPGTYTVREEQKDGWAQTFPASGSHSVALGINEDATSINFGNADAATVSGSKWEDRNGNGVWDEGESGLAGWTIVASPMTSEGEADTSRSAKETVTASDGSYSFNLLPNEFGPWRISEKQQEGWSQTYPTLPSYQEAMIDSSDDAFEDLNFGNWQSPIIEVFKWSDTDSNGEFSGSENPVKSWPMALGRVLSSGSSTTEVEIVDTALTDADGMAKLYAPAVEGDYVVLEGQRDEWNMTYPAPRSETVNASFASGVDQIDLDTTSYFDISIRMYMHGDVIDEGKLSAPDDEISQDVKLEFGNHQTFIGTNRGGNDSTTGGNPGQVLGASTSTESGQTGNVLGASCNLPLDTYIRRGRNNVPQNVMDLQNFLNAELKIQPPIPQTGFFGPITEAAVKAFQLKYYDEILKPWVDLGLLPANTPTGVVYKTTLWKIQMLGCPELNIPKPTLP